MKAITKLLTPLISVAVLVGCSTSPFERCASEFTSRINAAEKQFRIVKANHERGYKVHASREPYRCTKINFYYKQRGTNCDRDLLQNNKNARSC